MIMMTTTGKQPKSDQDTVTVAPLNSLVAPLPDYNSIYIVKPEWGGEGHQTFPSYLTLTISAGLPTIPPKKPSNDIKKVTFIARSVLYTLTTPW